MSKNRSIKRVEYGDFQTPLSLAADCCAVIRKEISSVATVVEPTCGTGAFAVAAADVFESAKIVAFDINPIYVAQAQEKLRSVDSASVRVQDFFLCDWSDARDSMEGPVLFLGNPPWVTNARLGVLRSNNLPEKSNVEKIRGIEAMTGRSNFDISESILQSLIHVMRPAEDALAMLVKLATARKVLKFAWSKHIPFSHASIRPIDSRRHFGVNVDACLLMLRRSDSTNAVQICLRSRELSTPAQTTAMGWFQDRLVADPGEASLTCHLQSTDQSAERFRWRSGVKHDVSHVLELAQENGTLCTQNGDRVDIEGDLVFPLAKGADVANSRTECFRRRILLTQRGANDKTSHLGESQPKTMQYLESHEQAFADRKSSIYRSRDRFALFGIGPYVFAPWKVAICGLYKHLTFTVYGPVDSRPVVFDDTSYFLSLDCQQQATFVRRLLVSEPARRFFQARIFWDAKRPITADLLRRLDLAAVARELRLENEYESLLATNGSRLLN